MPVLYHRREENARRLSAVFDQPPVLPLEGKVSPQATEEVSYRIAGCFDECRSRTKITSSVIRLAGDAGCHPPLEGRDFYAQLVSKDAKSGRSPPPSPSPRGEGVAAGDGRGVVPKSALLRRMRKRNDAHLSRHPACGRRRMPPQGEGSFARRSVPATFQIRHIPAAPLDIVRSLAYT